MDYVGSRQRLQPKPYKAFCPTGLAAHRVISIFPANPVSDDDRTRACPNNRHHVFNSRSDTLSVVQVDPLSNRFLFLGLVASVVVHVLALNLGPLQALLNTEPLRVEDWVVIVAVASTVLIGVEIEKLTRRGLACPHDPRLELTRGNRFSARRLRLRIRCL